ncbi:1,4-alpha-glucan branching protein GlgB [Lignipirellula cremea]|uniref:1,4-alpha-glucan branching enzyme GlgB n=1 Tax=Lignipirellula cremea TaxID=2528010 RepID=A0A518DW51_9BACT|nr:1,4-alpha-glucan branching protein GlgB [Lignipirellula cremea]QDU96054.1 1,4-alpha-glucan branching enzyme GlgB [Lignipirellula cremea]
MRTSVSLASVRALMEGRHGDPGSVLGPHEIDCGDGKAMAVRAFFPETQQAWILDAPSDPPRAMRKIHPAGLYEAICPIPAVARRPHYQLRVAGPGGEVKTMHDPYAFEPYLSDFDLYLFGEGSMLKAYEKFGAQMRTVDDTTGVNFAVWAPNARSVSVIGDFNDWDARRHPMRKLIPSGVWELFVPELEAGAHYKYRVTTEHGEAVDKSDPYGFAAELPPRTASIVRDLSQYQWGDQDWVEKRKKTNQLSQPISIYEVHLGSWRKQEGKTNGWIDYRDLARRLVRYCTQMGYTHIELLPVSEHPYSGSWGYQTVGYFAPTSRHGSPEDFMYFVDHCHQNGIGVLVDWVPAHFPRDGHGLRRFDGSPLFEHADPRQGEHPDWGTMIFNYGRAEVRTFLISNALFWLDKYHIDGLRVDAVASMLYLDYSREQGEWIPNQYGGRENIEAIDLLRKVNEHTHREFPGVLMVAEESTAWGGVSRPTSIGGLGFTFKWNMGWMNDSLRYMHEDPINRRHHHNELTFSMIYAFTENFMLPLSHDEVVHGKGSLLDQMPGDLWQKFANLRLMYSYMWTHPGKKLLFMGGEFGQWTEWNADTELQWDLLEWGTHGGLKQMVADLNAMYRREPALYEVDFEEAGFEWVDCMSADESILAYLRKAKDPSDFVLVCANFTPVVRPQRKIGVPGPGLYREIFNSDSKFYDGTDVGNGMPQEAKQEEAQGRPWSITVNFPPLGVCVFKPEPKAKLS